MAFALTRSWICSATGSTAKDFASCLPAHSSQGTRSFQGVGEEFDFVVGEPVLCFFEEFGDLVGGAGVVESEDGAAGGGCRRIPVWVFRGAPRGRRCRREGCFVGWRRRGGSLGFRGIGRCGCFVAWVILLYFRNS